MSWQRLGLIYVPDGAQPTAHSHASQPTPLHLRDDVYRFYFSARDADKRSHIHWVDVAVSETPRVIARDQAPVLSPGEDGSFDDSGVSIGSLVRVGEKIRLYYMGWNLGIRSPWRNAIGLAVADSIEGPFRRFSPGPILDRSPEDPYTLSYPWVMLDGADQWAMWYGSNLSAAVGNGDMQHTVKYARSGDGIGWQRNGVAVIPFETLREYAMARPSVARAGAGFVMGYACRGARYGIELSVSPDGRTWTRHAAGALRPADTGWDSEMTCYPALFTHRGRLWMAYNGNSYGASGFGLAVWDGAGFVYRL